MKLGETKVVLCLPSAGRRTQLIHPIFTQPGAQLVMLCFLSQIKGDFDAVAAKEDGSEMEDKGIKVAPAE